MTLKRKLEVERKKKEMFYAKLCFALLALFRYEKNEPKRSEANENISKKREAKLRVKIPNNFDANLCSALFTYFLIRLASLRLIISVPKLEVGSKKTEATSSSFRIGRDRTLYLVRSSLERGADMIYRQVRESPNGFK